MKSTSTKTSFRVDQLNNLLKSKQSDTATSSKNLANLREVLKLAHKLNGLSSIDSTTNGANQPNLNDLIDLIGAETAKSVRPQPQVIINKIERDLEESLRLLKRYNDSSVSVSFEDEDIVEDEEDEELHEFGKLDDDESSASDEMINANLDLTKYSRISDDEDDTSNDSARSPPFNADAKFTFDRNDKNRKNCTTNNKERKKSAKSKRYLKECGRRNSSSALNFIDQQLKLSAVGRGQAKFSYEKLNESDEKPVARKKSDDQKRRSGENTYGGAGVHWNYDELNELKLKFISLLSSSNAAILADESSQQMNIFLTGEDGKSENSDPRSSIKMVSPPLPLVSPPLSSPANNPQLISDPQITIPENDLVIPSNELQKVESFYQSFGTLLYTSKAYADLYTIPNMQLKNKLQEAFNRNSIAASTSIREDYSTSDLNDESLARDFLKDKYKHLISVHHRGIPLWLFNTGSNPRRPTRQLKFTLAERGTGFILWQDRVDSLSSFKLFLLDRERDKIIPIESLAHFNKLISDSEINDSLVLFKFKASDKKTSVFIKFDLTFEAVKFNEYFKRMISSLLAEVKQRAKSLPTGIGNVNSASSSAANFKLKTKKSSNDLKSYHGRFSNGAGEPNSSVRLKRITKSDISTPCNLKHIISLKTNEKDVYYTLSKLLPANTVIPSPKSSNSIESRCSSTTSSSCSPKSSSSSASSSAVVTSRAKKAPHPRPLEFVKVNNSTGSSSMFINKQIFMTSCSSFVEEKV